MDPSKKNILIEIINKTSANEFDWDFNGQTIDNDTMVYDLSHVKNAIQVINQELENFTHEELVKIKKINFKLGKTLSKLFKTVDSANHFYISLKLTKYLNENKDHIEVVHNLNKLGFAYSKINLFDKCFECFAESNQMITRLNKNNEFNNEYVHSLFNLSIVNKLKNDLDKSKYYIEESLNFLKNNYQNQNNQLKAEALYHLADYYDRLNNEEKSINLFIKSYEIRYHLFKNNENIDLCKSLFSLAACHANLNNYKEAIKYYEKARTMKQRIKKGDDQFSADLINRLGVFYGVTGKYFESLECKLESYKILYKCYETDNLVTAQILNNIGISYGQIGDDLTALVFKSKSFEMRERIFKRVDLTIPEYINSFISIGCTNLRIGKENEAFDYYFSKLDKIKNENLSLYQQSLIEYYLASYYGCKAFYDKCFEKAETSYKMRLELYQSVDNSYIAFSLTQLSIYYEKVSNYKESLKKETESFNMRKRLYSDLEIHPLLAQNMTNLSIIYQKMDDLKNSISLEEESIKMKNCLFGKKCHPILADSYVRLWKLYCLNDDKEKADQYRIEAIRIRSNLFKNSKTVSFLKINPSEDDLEFNNYNNGDYCSRIFNFI